MEARHAGQRGRARIKKARQIPLTETYILSYRIGKDLDMGRTHTNHDTARVAEFATEETTAALRDF